MYGTVQARNFDATRIEVWECPPAVARARVSLLMLDGIYRKTDAKDGYYLSANLRSKYRRTPMTLAASTSRAGLFSRWLPCRSRGFGRVCSLGSQDASSSVAREKLGCRDKVVKVSAHDRVNVGVLELRVDHL